MVWEEKEYCRRCGAVVYEFSKKLAESTGSRYCVKCAEELDRIYLVKNTCSVCSRLLGRSDVKMVMPSRMYNSVRGIPLENRLICANCYKRVAKRNITRSYLDIDQIRSAFRRSIVRRTLMRAKN